MRLVVALSFFLICAVAAEDIEPETSRDGEAVQSESNGNTLDSDSANATAIEEDFPVLPPIKLDEDVACAACEHVVSRIYAHIKAVRDDAKGKPIKERKEIATKIIRNVCYQSRGVTLSGKAGYRYFKNPARPQKNEGSKTSNSTDADAVDASAEDGAEAEDADLDEGKEESAVEGEEEKEQEPEQVLEETEDDRLLYQACYYMMATEGYKLRSRIAGFYKETSHASLTRRLCKNSLALCDAPRAPRPKRSEKCLKAAFANLANQKWEKATLKSDCAKEFTVTSEPLKKKKKKKTKKKRKGKKGKKTGSEEENKESEGGDSKSEEKTA